MARAQPYTMAQPRSGDGPNALASGSRPSAFDRFPMDKRNKWLNDMQATIDRALNPPPPPGPSRSPSPLEQDVSENTIGYEDDIVVSEENDEDESDVDEGYEEGEAHPLAIKNQVKQTESEDGFYEDEEDEEADEGFEEDEELEDATIYSQQFPQQRIENGDPLGQNLNDPRLEDQLEGEYEEYSEDEEEEDELEGEGSQSEDLEGADTEDDVMYVGDTASEEEEKESEEGQDAEMFVDQEAELEEDELDDDGMGDPEEGYLEEEEGLGDQVYQAAPVGVEDGQMVYDLPASQTVLPEVTYTNPYQLAEELDIPQPSTSALPSSTLYPPLPDFTIPQPTFTSAAQMVPPWEPTPLDQTIIPDQNLESDLIDPSLLADFAQRVEAQASGDLGNTTEAQNTEEITALADAVMDQYDETAPAPLLGEQETFQHGMGEAEGDGYEEDHDSQSSTGTGVEPSSQPVEDDQADSDEEEAVYSDEEMESGDDAESASVTPEFVNTADDPIELLSSDEEEEDDQDGQEDDQEPLGSNQEDEQGDDQDQELDEDDEEEETEEVEPERPATSASHIRFDVDRSDMLTPPRTSSRSSARTPISSQPVSPLANRVDSSAPEEIDELEEEVEDDDEEEDEEDEDEDEDPNQDENVEETPSPVIPEPESPSAIPQMDPIRHSPSEALLTEDQSSEEQLPEAQLPAEQLPEERHPQVTTIETTEEMEVDDTYEVEEPISRGPSMPLVTPAVELPLDPLDTIFPSVPEASLDAIMRVLAEQPAIIEESEHTTAGTDDNQEMQPGIVENEIVAVGSTTIRIDEESVSVEDEIVAVRSTSMLADEEERSNDDDESSTDEAAIIAEDDRSTPEDETMADEESVSVDDEIVAISSTSIANEEEGAVDENESVTDEEAAIFAGDDRSTPEDEVVAVDSTSILAYEDVDANDLSAINATELAPGHVAESLEAESVTESTFEVDTGPLPDPHSAPSETDLTMPDVPFHRSRTPSLVVEPPAQAPDPESVEPIVIDYAMVETTSEVLPDPHAEPVATELTMPDVPFHRSRTPSLIVEPPANPPNPDIIIDRPIEDELASPTDLPDPQDPIPDSHIAPPLSPHDMRPTIQRSPSTFVNVQEIDMMLDPGPNDDREDTPVEFPDHDQPAPQTDLVAPMEPRDMSPRDEPRSVSMEALAPGEAPLEEMIATATGTANSREESPVTFPQPGEAAPNTYIPSPLDVRRDLPLDIGVGSDAAPSLIVEPPSEPMTGPPSLTGSGGEEVQSGLLGLPDIVIDDQEEPDTAPTSSSIDAPSAPLRAVTPSDEKEAGPSNSEQIRFLSPLRHHHGHGPRQASVPPPTTTRTTRRHTRQSSHAVEALSPPVTRQNCHYRKLYMVQDDMSAVVLVPQCTLTDNDKLEEEHAEDRGDATPADEDQARHQPICEATPRLQLALTAKLHRIVGSDIFDEAQKTYLLHASDEALLLDGIEDKVETEIVASSSKTTRASTSPIKPRRSKRLSEAPSETSIKEELTTGRRRGVSIAKTASPVPEVEETDVVESEPYNLRSKSEAPQLEQETNEEPVVDMETDDDVGSEIIAEAPPQASSSLTASPVSVKKDDHSLSKRYSLRSQPDVPESKSASGDRQTTPTPAPVAETQTTPMTTRKRARESAAPSTSGQSPSIGKKPLFDEQPVEFEEPSTPQKGRRKSVVRSKGKGKASQEDSKYVYEAAEEEDGDGDVIKVAQDDDTATESSADIIPFTQSEAGPSPSTTGTGRKKRKLRMSISSQGNNSPWQLERQDLDTKESPSGGRGKSKKRAVESKDEPDVPTPQDVGDEDEGEEEVAALPPPKGWMSYIWPFKRS